MLDTATALLSDLPMAAALSKVSPFVAESKRSPHYQKMMAGIKEIGKRNNHLTKAQLSQLSKDRQELFKRQVINPIRKTDDLENANLETIELTAILSKYGVRFRNGELSHKSVFAEPTLDVLARSAYGGTTGIRLNEDGTRDHTAMRMHVASDIKRISEMGNLSFKDKRRLMDSIKVINKSEDDDVYLGWTKEQRKLKEAQQIRSNRVLGSSIKVALGSNTIDWASLV